MNYKPRISSRSLSRALHELQHGRSAAPYLTGYATTPEIDAQIMLAKRLGADVAAFSTPSAPSSQILTIQQGTDSIVLDATRPWTVTPSDTTPPPPTNLPPNADFSFASDHQTVAFRDLSSDPDGTITSRMWIFGDGDSSTLANPVHHYATAGSYVVRLTVSDDGSPALQSVRSQAVALVADVIPPNPTIETTFDHFYPPSFALSQATSTRTIGAQAKPIKTPVATPGYSDANHATKVWRMTDRLTESNAAGTGHNRHEYSKRDPWNCDSTRYITTDNAGFWHLFDAASFVRIRQMPGFAGDCEPIWAPDDRAKLLHTGPYGALVWSAYDVISDTTTVAFDLTSKLPAGFTGAARAWFKGEGRPSNDGRYFALMIETANYAHLGVVMYDRVAGAVVGWLRQSERPDNSMTSPLGNYMLVAFGDGVRAYPRTYQGTAKLDGRRLASLQHNDVALDAGGNEVLVTADYSSEPLNGFITVTNIASGAGFAISLADLYPANGGCATGAHVSGIVSKKRPGWAIVNFESSSANYGAVHPDPVVRYVYDRVCAVELKPNGRLLHIAEHFSCPNDDGTGNGYWSEPQATSNADGTRIAFASSWTGRNGLPIGLSESFMVGLPSTAIPA